MLLASPVRIRLVSDEHIGADSEIYFDCTLVDSISSPIYLGAVDYRMNFEEAVVTKNYALPDVVTKIMYFSLAAAALVFVSMLLLAGVHF
jgi:hypothetical protein